MICTDNEEINLLLRTETFIKLFTAKYVRRSGSSTRKEGKRSQEDKITMQRDL